MLRPPTQDALRSQANTPIDRGEAVLARTGPLADRASEGALALRTTFEAGPSRRRQPLLVGGEAAADSVVSVIEGAHRSGAASVLINVFGTAPSEAQQALQVDAVEAAFFGGMAIALTPDFVENDPRLRAALEVALSASVAGFRAREVILGRPPALDPTPPARQRRRMPPIDFGEPLTGVRPTLPAGLLRDGERFARTGCLNSLLSAIQTLGNAVAAQSPRYRSGAHIDAFSLPNACPGDLVTISGSGFGPKTDAGVVFTSTSERPILVPSADCPSWSDEQIEVVVPADTGKGAVGIVDVPQPTGGETPATLAADATGEAMICLSPIAGERLGELVGKMTAPVLSLPPMQSDRLNYYAGGAPKVRAFSADRQTLWPGTSVTLRWIVEGASSVTIAPVAPGAGIAAHELPPIAGPLDAESGSVTVQVPATRPWTGSYVLSATNACTGGTPVQARYELRMVLRRGFALGGGGSRGDFQVGALRYLYDIKGIRPDAIAATSVGAINAAELVMGDSAAGNGAARLESVWRSLTGNSSMWLDEPWLVAAKADIRQLVRSLSLEGLLSLPYSLVMNAVAIDDLVKGALAGPAAFFNLSPIETLMTARFSTTSAQASGIELRLVAVSLETSEVIQVDQHGGIISRETPTGQRSSVINGAMASAAMPSIFPARQIGDHMCVDGGVRDVVPVQIAVEELGCNEVYAFSLSAPLPHLPFKQNRSILEVAARTLSEIVFDELTDDDVAPYRGWGDTVQVHLIDASMNVHDPLTIDPGLIDIAIGYGWMRAGDQIDTPAPARKRSRELSDAVTTLRGENWEHAFRASGQHVRDRHGSFPILDGALPATRSEIRPIADPEAVDDVRANCLRIRALLQERLALGAPTPPPAIRNAWWTQWETVPDGPLGTPWDEFISKLGTRPAVVPPPAV